MKEKFGDRLTVKIYTNDSEEAKGYTFKGSTNVFFDNNLLPRNIITKKEKMEEFLLEQL